MPCIEKDDSRREPPVVETSIDASEEQSDSENTGACGKVKRKHTDHIADDKGMWEVFTVAWYTSQLKFKKLCEDARIQRRSGQIMELFFTKKAWDVKKMRPKCGVIRPAKEGP